MTADELSDCCWAEILLIVGENDGVMLSLRYSVCKVEPAEALDIPGALMNGYRKQR
jgi:hypothetical protein